MEVAPSISNFRKGIRVKDRFKAKVRDRDKEELP